jgi:TPR repeat protein
VEKGLGAPADPARAQALFAKACAVGDAVACDRQKTAQPHAPQAPPP